jgi:hypothetical protein
MNERCIAVVRDLPALRAPLSPACRDFPPLHLDVQLTLQDPCSILRLVVKIHLSTEKPFAYPGRVRDLIEACEMMVNIGKACLALFD